MYNPLQGETAEALAHGGIRRRQRAAQARGNRRQVHLGGGKDPRIHFAAHLGGPRSGPVRPQQAAYMASFCLARLFREFT